jgi:hypothetical protein
MARQVDTPTLSREDRAMNRAVALITLIGIAIV